MLQTLPTGKRFFFPLIIEPIIVTFDDLGGRAMTSIDLTFRVSVVFLTLCFEMEKKDFCDPLHSPVV